MHARGHRLQPETMGGDHAIAAPEIRPQPEIPSPHRPTNRKTGTNDPITHHCRSVPQIAQQAPRGRKRFPAFCERACPRASAWKTQERGSFGHAALRLQKRLLVGASSAPECPRYERHRAAILFRLSSAAGAMGDTGKPLSPSRLAVVPATSHSGQRLGRPAPRLHRALPER